MNSPDSVRQVPTGNADDYSVQIPGLPRIPRSGDRGASFREQLTRAEEQGKNKNAGRRKRRKSRKKKKTKRNTKRRRKSRKKRTKRRRRRRCR